MPRDISFSDSKCWNGGHEWVKCSETYAQSYILSSGYNRPAKDFSMDGVVGFFFQCNLALHQ